jgi:hypothetical protein
MNGFLFARLLSNRSASGKPETYDERHKKDKTAPTSDNVYNFIVKNGGKASKFQIYEHFNNAPSHITSGSLIKLYRNGLIQRRQIEINGLVTYEYYI